jgi:hypothetical protein
VSKLAAQVLGFLTTILVLVVWSVVSSNLPVSIGLGVHLIAIIGSCITGLMTYISTSR